LPVALSGIFLRGGLDSPNQLEAAEQIAVLAQVDLMDLGQVAPKDDNLISRSPHVRAWPTTDFGRGCLEV
jgi:hypothetical protein